MLTAHTMMKIMIAVKLPRIPERARFRRTQNLRLKKIIKVTVRRNFRHLKVVKAQLRLTVVCQSKPARP